MRNGTKSLTIPVSRGVNPGASGTTRSPRSSAVLCAECNILTAPVRPRVIVPPIEIGIVERRLPAEGSRMS